MFTLSVPHRKPKELALNLKFSFGTPPPATEPLLKVRAPRVDLYSVGNGDRHGMARFAELAKAVLVAHRPHHHARSELLGLTGHCERFNAWSHLVAFVACAVFATVRQVSSPEGVAGAMTSVAAWSVVSVFLASCLYHITAPDEQFAKVSRFLDFFSIYASIVLTSSADLAVVTRGFEDVPVVTILDLPLAGIAVAAFFLLRRLQLATNHTWVERHVHTHEHGLFCRGHDDLHHLPLRSSTSLLLAASFILVLPVACASLPDVAGAFVLFQVLAFVVVIVGMVVDNVFMFPNHGLLHGRFRCFAFPRLGFVINSHGLWHILSIVSVALTVSARELAISSV